MSIDRHLVAALLTLGAMVVIGVWVLSMATPSSEAARLRNALLATPGEPGDFTWMPAQKPASFLQEHGQATETLKAAYGRIQQERPSEDLAFGTALAIARHLKQHKPRGGAIMADVDTSYRRITGNGTGYCADFTQVFNGLAYVAGIPVREWGMSFDGFGGNGHAFSEIYDARYDKWIFLDSFYAFYVVDAHSGTPLSVLEFRDALLDRRDDGIRVLPVLEARFGFRTRQQALDYYRRGLDQFYLWWGNNVFSYDAHPLLGKLTSVSRSLEQLAAIALGLHPGIHLLSTDSNQVMVRDLLRLRARLLAALALECGLLLLLVFFLFRYWRQRSRRMVHLGPDTIRES